MFTKNASLHSFNTFGIDCNCLLFKRIQSLDEVKSIWKSNIFDRNSPLILGGGSNILFTKDYQGLVLKNEIPGIKIIKETENEVWIDVGAGIVWHQFVMYCVDNNYGGVENLSLIPGTVGAAPIQNIGAYGVEQSQVFESLETFNLFTGETLTLKKDDCNFGYRNSIFKNEYKGQWLISSVVYRLQKNPAQFNISYGDIQKQLEVNGHKPSLKSVSDAIIAIRQSKLPDPALLGNAGSFFKNPTITKDQYNQLQNSFSEIKGFEAPNNHMKLAAAWLIEQCGWKGKKTGHTGSHEKQALVLVNYGGANGNEIKQLSIDIIRSVKEKFGVELETEVNII